MIVDWIVSNAVGFWSWLLGLMPDWSMPAELANADDTVNGLFRNIDGLGAWVNFPIVGVLAAIPPILWVIMINWKAFRMAVSHLPFIGGK